MDGSTSRSPPPVVSRPPPAPPITPKSAYSHSHIHTAKPPPPAAAASFSAGIALGGATGVMRSGSQLPTLPPPPTATAPVLTLPEPLQPPLIYSSGPLATHPSAPLGSRFNVPHTGVMQVRMPQLLPRAPNPANSPPGMSVIPPPASAAPQNRPNLLKGALACEACRYMHVRCNGTHPCDQCTRRRVPCSFSTYKRKGTATTTMVPNAAGTHFNKWSDQSVKAPPPGYLIGPDGNAWPQQPIRRATLGASSSGGGGGGGTGSSPAFSHPGPSIPRAIAPAPPPPPPSQHVMLGDSLGGMSGFVSSSLLQRAGLGVQPDPRQIFNSLPMPPLSFPGRLAPPPEPLTAALDSLTRDQMHASDEALRPLGGMHTGGGGGGGGGSHSQTSAALEARNAESVLGLVNRHWHQLNRINWCRQHKDVAPVYASVSDMVQRGPGAELDVGAVYFTLDEWRTVSRALHKLGFAVRGRTIMITTAVIEIFPLLRDAFMKQLA